MDGNRRGRNAWVLGALVLVALAYCVLLGRLRTLTGTTLLDGGIGVVLGLYVCSHPAANAIDLLFLGRGTGRYVASEWSALGWLALNVLVMAVGWLVIVIGATRFVG